MYKILKATKDTYIADKIINNKFRATDANVGLAATLDLFKLYSESTLPGTSSGLNEISRLLIKFDLDPLRALTGSILDYTRSSFNCKLQLFDVIGGQTIPSNFKVIVFPLSQSFDEGRGRDIVSFEDLDSCNFITASASGNTAVNWFLSGANKQGVLGSTNIDIISSGNLSDGNGVVNLWQSQLFTLGTEDLSIDITTLVSATLASQIPDHGFRISFSGTQETDTSTRFVKRFASRHSTNTRIRPRIVVAYDDSTRDDTANFFFDITGSVFLNNFHRGAPANIVSGTSATAISGNDCLVLRLVSGSYQKVITGSQQAIGTNFVTGVYSASFAISSYDTSDVDKLAVGVTASLRDYVVNSGSITFDAFWASLDNRIGYLTSSLTLKANPRSFFSNVEKRLNINVTNSRHAYKSTENVKFRVFAELIDDDTVIFKKSPIVAQSSIFSQMYYRVVDFNSNDTVIPFERTYGGTLLSTDNDGMYFSLDMTSLDVGRTYELQFLIIDRGIEMIFEDSGARFKVEA